MEEDGSVPVRVQFWASWRAVVGFCEVGVPPPHFTPATDSCGILVVSFNASQRTAGQYSLHLSQKNLKYFGGGICVHSYVGGEAGSALPVHPRSSHLMQSHLFTHSTLSQQGWGCSGAYRIGDNVTVSTPGKMWSWTKTFLSPQESQSMADLNQSVWWLLYFSRHGISRHDNWWTHFLESQELKADVGWEC